MSTVLIVDDRPANRQFLATHLGYRGHRLLEASDGAEALRLAQAERPDLIITEILMPTMDGQEFVQQLREDPAIAGTPVVFSTAHFLGREASALARRCGVSFILSKPCEPEEVLRTADAALGLTESPAQAVDGEGFDREQLRLLTDKLAQEVDELKAVKQKMAVLIEVGHQLASEHHSLLLLEEYCRAARVIIGATCAAVGVLNEDEQTLGHFYVCGAGDRGVEGLGYPQPDDGIPGKLLREDRPWRIGNLDGDPRIAGFPPDFPPVYSLLGVPIMFQARVYGWLCLANKLGGDEFSEEDEELAATLAAQMAVAYENTLLYSEVQDYTGELEVEVDERKRTEEERAKLLAREREARKKAEEASRAKDLFLATVSHELRVPLNAILGWTHVLRSAECDATTLAYAIETIERNIGMQVQLIEDLMDTARIENGKLRLNQQPLDLAPVVQATVDVMRPAAEAKGIQLILTCDPGASLVTGDPGRLQQIVWNLLSNAIRFTPGGGCIAVRLQRSGSHAQIVVTDTGQGIGSELLPHVFERFIQSDDSGARRHGGLGIGLALVRQLVEMHGGSVQADSLGEGHGTVFTVKLPLRTAGARVGSSDKHVQASQRKRRARPGKRKTQ